MVIEGSRHRVLAGRLVRLALLVPLADLIGHDAVYEAGTGVSHALGGTVGGHHGYWPLFGIIVAILAASVLASGLRRVVALRRALDRSGPQLSDGRGAPGSGYHRELLAVWLALFPATVALYSIQENVEHLASGLGFAGLEPVVAGGGQELILLALASLSVSLVGALVRWQVQVLEARLAVRSPREHRRPTRLAGPTPGWGLVAAMCRLRWNLVRPDAERAPPLVA